MKSLILAATLALVPFSTPAWASGAGERAAHFEGKRGGEDQAFHGISL